MVDHYAQDFQNNFLSKSFHFQTYSIHFNIELLKFLYKSTSKYACPKSPFSILHSMDIQRNIHNNQTILSKANKIKNQINSNFVFQNKTNLRLKWTIFLILCTYSNRTYSIQLLWLISIDHINYKLWGQHNYSLSDKSLVLQLLIPNTKLCWID